MFTLKKFFWRRGQKNALDFKIGQYLVRDTLDFPGEELLVMLKVHIYLFCSFIPNRTIYGTAKFQGI